MYSKLLNFENVFAIFHFTESLSISVSFFFVNISLGHSCLQSYRQKRIIFTFFTIGCTDCAELCNSGLCLYFSLFIFLLFLFLLFFPAFFSPTSNFPSLTDFSRFLGCRQLSMAPGFGMYIFYKFVLFNLNIGS